ncbi:VOC family protein [Micromonosporaceae bacterium Da 78-11]
MCGRRVRPRRPRCLADPALPGRAAVLRRCLAGRAGAPATVRRAHRRAEPAPSGRPGRRALGLRRRGGVLDHRDRLGSGGRGATRVPPPAARPADPDRILLQRVGEARPATAHLDVSCSDLAAGREWDEQLGAETVGEWPYWTTLRDPAGSTYCLTAGDPATD